MSYDSTALRTLPADFGDHRELKDPLYTFVCITGAGVIAAANTVAEKQQMLDAFQGGDTLLLAWHGQYKTDMFSLPIERAREWFKKPKRKAA